ncbi:MAG TPA: hypothetical protein VLG14_00710 [Sphingomonas sp.]|jgi:hypothetical protein|nr:hypothetical protein [Sphingomonas sp.]
MIDSKSADLRHDDALASGKQEQALAKEIWSKPEIVDYQPVTVARGLSYRIGDGFSNLS